MTHCCDDKSGELQAVRAGQGWALYFALAINGAMFLVELAAGWLAESTALLADSLDMLGDATVYAVTLFAMSADARTRAGIALLKGGAMAAFGLLVLIQGTRQTVAGNIPDLDLMLTVGAAALVANAVCFALLFRHRSDDLNMRSTWLCTRNDLINNLSVLLAAGLVHATGRAWPDRVTGTAIALLFLHSGYQVLVAAWREWRGAEPMTLKKENAL